MIKRTVLIVDDEKVNRRILGKILEDEYNIMEASDGGEALEILSANAELISAVLLDIVMPKIDGYEVLQKMKDDVVLSKIPVIVSSQKIGDDAEIRALSLGAQDFIAKPYKPQIIRHRLSNLIKFRETAAMINEVKLDELTGLYNKQFFLKNVNEWIHQYPDQRFDLMCFGIERFRLINERFGNEKGDELLRYIAQLIKSAEQPIFSARFSADYYYLLLAHREVYNAKILKEWYDKVDAFPINMDIKLHCGIYQIRDIDMPVSVMCDRAQMASNKNKGVFDVAYCMYDNSLHQKLLEEQFIVSNMQTALKEGQFKVYYQPKYEITNNLIAGAEALVRWVHPDRGGAFARSVHSGF